jgi:hypothetical protein
LAATLVLPVFAVEPFKQVARPIGIAALYISIFKDRF